MCADAQDRPSPRRHDSAPRERAEIPGALRRATVGPGEALARFLETLKFYLQDPRGARAPRAARGDAGKVSASVNHRGEHGEEVRDARVRRPGGDLRYRCSGRTESYRIL